MRAALWPVERRAINELCPEEEHPIVHVQEVVVGDDLALGNVELTKQLRELEADGVSHRQVFAEVPPRVEYSLTEKGESLLPVVAAMKQWGEQFVA